MLFRCMKLLLNHQASYSYIHVYIHTHIHVIYIHTYKHTYIHTHTFRITHTNYILLLSHYSSSLRQLTSFVQRPCSTRSDSRWGLTTMNSPALTLRTYMFDVYGSMHSLFPRICACLRGVKSVNCHQIRSLCTYTYYLHAVLTCVTYVYYYNT